MIEILTNATKVILNTTQDDGGEFKIFFQFLISINLLKRTMTNSIVITYLQLDKDHKYFNKLVKYRTKMSTINFDEIRIKLC